MAKSLLIVESPTKAKTLERYLGKDFIVKASVGHVKDLPKNKLGIDLEHQFQPEYEALRGKKSILKELSQAAAKAETIYLGPDPDREGEAIAWHIAEEIGAKDKAVYRVLFHELTQKAIEEALAHPEPLNRSLYEAQQTRRILDRLVGYLISPLLWEKVKRGLSAGRVQSVAVRLICEREREIQRFEAEEYWTITAQLSPQAALEAGLKDPGDRAANAFSARLWRCQKQKCKIPSETEATRLVDTLRSLEYRVAKVERKKQRKNPVPPFITSTLQQEAARKLRFAAKRTMIIAQRLYEGIELGTEGADGLITYMRTDSTRLSSDSVQAVRGYIEQMWGKAYVPAKPTLFKSKKSAQDAHEAIRPTDVTRSPEAVAPFLTKEQLALYSLIWKRFVACQMAPAVIAQTTMDVAAGSYVFRATGSVVEFPGFMKVYVESRENGEPGKDEEGRLPDLPEGQKLSLLGLIPKQHFTQPPPRFSEAGLIKELEERGIGRPSTYAAILTTIVDKEYVRLEKPRLIPTELGFLINDLLVANFPDIVDVEFTAKMEGSLDAIAANQYPYLQLLEGFYGQFARTLETAREQMLNLKREGVATELECPRCQRRLHIKWSRNGPFLGCSGYPDCGFTSDYERNEKGCVTPMAARTSSEVCASCGLPMLVKRGRFGSFLACSGYPECKTTRSLQAENQAPASPPPPPQYADANCEKCGGRFVIKNSRFGIPFLSCEHYPKCKNSRPITTGLPCPRKGCGGELVERASKKGRRFFGCSTYPACKTAFWEQPVRESCPECGAPILLEKHTKRQGAKLVCPNPECKYQRSVGETSEGGEATRERTVQ